MPKKTVSPRMHVHPVADPELPRSAEIDRHEIDFSESMPGFMALASGDELGSSFVSDEGEIRYRIILGDTCPVCRAVSRMSFTTERPPQIPIAGCQEADGCRCTLPIFAAELDAALASPQPSLAALAPSRGALPTELQETPPEVSPPPEYAPPREAEPQPAPRRSPPGPPEWSQPAPITRRRRHDLVTLTASYYHRRIQGIRIQTTPGCCRICADVAASIYEPAVAPPLPVVGCWQGWQCRCNYAEEPLPLDERGLEALNELAFQERERRLRRRKVARFAPRPHHQLVVVIAALIAFAALWQDSAAQPPAPWAVVIPLALGGACAALAVGAIRRSQSLPSPPWVEAFSGLTVAFIGLQSLFWVRFSPLVGFQHLDHLREERVALNLTPDALQSLSPASQALVVGGVILLLLGLLGLAIAPGYKRAEPMR